MRLDDLAVFERVVREGSYTAAAAALGLGKSTVSERIRRLESDLGVRLLQRTTRSVGPTPDGASLYRHAARVVAEARAAADALGRARDEPVGLLRVTCPRLFGYAFLGPVIARFLDAHPRCDVDVHLAERPVDLVEEGFDLALRIGALPDSSLVVRRLGRAPMVYAASPAYLADRPAVTPDTLAAHDCITVSRSGPARWPLGTPDGVRAVPVAGRLHANSLVLARDAALSGIGVAFLPRFLVADVLVRGLLVEVLVDHVPPPMPVNALYPSARHLSPRVRRFLDLLVAEAARTPPWDPPGPPG